MTETEKIAKYDELCGLLIETLTIYADPGFYHAIVIIGDAPTGGFDEDVSVVPSRYDRPMPGKAARDGLDAALEFVKANPDAFGARDD